MPRKLAKYGTMITHTKISRIVHTTHRFVVAKIVVEINFQLQT
jgi:hypothetical protein